MTKEALKLALVALEEINQLSIGENAVCLPAEIDTAMDAIKEALAQRTWVGLTDKELNVIGSQWHFNLLGNKDKTDLFEFARAIEAKLKEKNK